MVPKIETLMSPRIFRIDAGRSVQDAVDEMARLNVGSLLVMRNGKFEGMLTEVDIVRKVVAKKRMPSEVLVEEIMASPLITIDAEESIVEANALMEEKQIRHLAVTRSANIVGVVSVRDFLHPLTMEDVPEEGVMQMSG